MQENLSKREQLYNNLLATKKVTANEIGTKDEFLNALSSPDKVKQFHSNLLSVFSEKEIGNNDDFYKSIESDFSSSQKPMFFEQGFNFNEEVKNPRVTTPTSAFTPYAPEAMPQIEQDYNDYVKTLPTTDNIIRESLKGVKEKIDVLDAELLKKHKPSQVYIARRDGMDAERNNPYSVNPDLRKVRAARNMIDDAEKQITAAEKYFGGSFMGGVGRGLVDKGLDLKTWDLGLGEWADMGELKSVVDKFEKNQPLTSVEDELLNAFAINAAVKNYYSDTGFGYKAGAVTGESLPFMLEMAVNPLSSSGQVIGKGIAKYIVKKYGSKFARTAVGKGLRVGGRVAGDVAAAYGMAATTGLPGIVGDVKSRQIGQAKYGIDENGIEFTGTAEKASTSEAILDAVNSRAIENYSEMFGMYFPYMKNIPIVKNSKIVKAVENSALGKAYSNFLKTATGETIEALKRKTLFNGTFGEYAEEKVGEALNIAFVGDQKAEDYFDTDKNIETFLGVSILGGAFSAASVTGMAANGAILNPISRYNEHRRFVNQYNNSTNEYNALIGRLRSEYNDNKELLEVIDSLDAEVRLGNSFRLDALGVDRNKKTDINAGINELLDAVNSRNSIIEDLLEQHKDNKDIDKFSQTILDEFKPLLSKQVSAHAAAYGYYETMIESIESKIGPTFNKFNNKNVFIAQKGDERFYITDIAENKANDGKRLFVVRNENTGEVSTIAEKDFDSFSVFDKKEWIDVYLQSSFQQEIDAYDPNNDYTNRPELIEGEAYNFKGKSIRIDRVSADGTIVFAYDYETGKGFIIPEDEIGEISYFDNELEESSDENLDTSNENIDTSNENLDTSNEIKKGKIYLYDDKRIIVEDISEDGDMVFAYDPENDIHFIVRGENQHKLLDANSAKINQQGETGVNSGENSGVNSGEFLQDETQELSGVNSEQNSGENSKPIVEYPKDKHGYIDYSSITDESMYAEALLSEFSEDESINIIDEIIKNLKSELEKASKINDPIQRRRKQQSITAEIDKYSNIKSKISPNQTSEIDEEVEDSKNLSTLAAYNRDKEILLRFDPVSREFAIAQMILAGIKISLADKRGSKGFISHLGLGHQEAKTFFSIRDDKNGYTPERLAEMISDTDTTGLFLNMDTMEILDVVLSVFKQCHSRKAAMEYMKDELKGTIYDPFITKEELEEIQKVSTENNEIIDNFVNSQQNETSDNNAGYSAEYQHYLDTTDDLPLTEEEYYQNKQQEYENAIRDNQGDKSEISGVDNRDTKDGAQQSSEGSGGVKGNKQGETEIRTNEQEEPDRSDDGSTPEILSEENRSESEVIESSEDKQQKLDEIATEESKVNQSPTDAQKEAGNYKKGHVTIQGLSVTIENPKGSTRSGVDAAGKEWSIQMNNTYGYILGTTGRDKDHIDVFLGDNPLSTKVFVIDQVGKDGSFDEHKVMLGFDSIEEAKAAYLSNYEDGWQGLGNITETDIQSFTNWAKNNGSRIKPFAEYKIANITTDVDNKIFTEQAKNDALAKLKAKLNNLNAGFDPEIVFLAMQVGGYYVEKGIRKFAKYAKTMIDEVGDAIKPYLKTSYNAIRDTEGMEEIAKEMDSYEVVKAFDINTLNDNKDEQQSETRATTEAIESKTKAIETASKQLDTNSETIADDQQKAGKLVEEYAKVNEEIEDALKEVDDAIMNLRVTDKEYSTEGVYDEIPIRALAKGPIKKDVLAYVHAIAKATNLELNKDEKGRPDHVMVNIAPSGGDVTFFLWSKSNPNIGVYVSIPFNVEFTENGERIYKVHKRDERNFRNEILYRVTTSKNKYSGLGNNYTASTSTVKEMSEKIVSLLNEYYISNNIETREVVSDIKVEQKGKSVKTNAKKENKIVDNTSTLFNFDEQSDSTNNDKPKSNGKPERTGSEKANPGMGGAKQQETRGSNQEGVGKSNGADNVYDGVRSGGVSGLSTEQQITENPKQSKEEDQEVVSVKNNQNNNRNERGVNYFPTSPKARFNANIEAIKVLRELENSGAKMASKEQMAVLRKYSGWGGLGSYLTYSNSEEYRLLKSLFSQEDIDGLNKSLESAEESTATAFYTPVEIVEAMWDIVSNLGFKGGVILESSAGIGNIIGSIPSHINDKSNIHAIEIDRTSGSILKYLYPDAKVDINGFEDTRIENGSVDLAITNVPFVTGLSVFDKVDNDLSKQFTNIHDFFIAKNTRKLRDGGIGIFITTKGTLDSSKKLREWLNINGQADIIGAYRLNNSTFEGANVTSDIIVVRKRENNIPFEGAIQAMNTAVERVAVKTEELVYNSKKGIYEDKITEFPLVYNEYFVRNPQYMGGTMMFAFEKSNSTWRELSTNLYSVEGINQQESLKNWVSTFKPIFDNSKNRKVEQKEVIKTDVKEGSLIAGKDGSILISRRGEAVETDINNNKIKGYSKAECLKDYQNIRNALNELIEYQLRSEEDAELNNKLKALNSAYDTFVKKYGRLNQNTAISFLKQDVEFHSISAIENCEEIKTISGETKLEYSKTDVFNTRILGSSVEPNPKTIEDAISASMFKFGYIDIQYISDALNISKENAVKYITENEIGFIDPITGKVEIGYVYLSGNIREKLSVARDNNVDNKYDANIKALEKVMPMEIPAHLIKCKLGATWLPKEYYEEFIYDETRQRVTLSNVAGTWMYNSEPNKHSSFDRSAGTAYALGSELILHTMNSTNKVVRITNSETKESKVDIDETLKCNAKIEEFKNRFDKWLKDKISQNLEISSMLTNTYNNKYNNYTPMEIMEKYLPERFIGAVDSVSLYPHQKSAVIRSLLGPLILAHEVGTGKTFTLITIAMEMRRLGTAKKPMIVVQNATVGQFVTQAKRLYPNAKILTLTDRDRNREGRFEFYGKIKYNDWDMVIIPQSTLDMIPDHPDREKQFILEKIDEKMNALSVAEASRNRTEYLKIQKDLIKLNEELDKLDSDNDSESDEKGAKTKKSSAGNKAIKNTAVQAKQQLNRKVDDVQYFEDLGIDAILVDEAHAYKNLGFSTSIQGVKGINPAKSKRAASLYIKCRTIFEKNGWKNAVFATGTPISNTAAELWVFMKYFVKPEILKELNIYYFDDFVKNFGSIEILPEYATNGKYKSSARFSNYMNVPELIRIWHSVSDTVLTKDVGYVNDKVPKLETGKAQDIFIDQSPSFRRIMRFVFSQLEAYEKMSGKEKRENKHIPIVMYGLAQSAAIDARLIDPEAKDEPLSKTNKTVEQVLLSLEQTKSYKGTVAVFCDRFQRKDRGTGNVTFDIYEDIKRKLIEKGVPAEQISIIRSGMSVAKKEAIFKQVNDGTIRVIMGSTGTLGTGVNIQERLHTLIHVDAPNRPMDYTQRNGRLLRQGNLHKEWNREVRVVRFGVDKSLDVTAYQRLKTKSKFIDKIMNGKGILFDPMSNREIEEEDEGIFDNPIATFSGSEFALMKFAAEKRLKKLKSQIDLYHEDQVFIHNRIKDSYRSITYLQSKIRESEEAIEILNKYFPDGVKKLTINGENVPIDSESLEKYIKDNINKSVNEYIEKGRVDYTFKRGTITFDIKVNDARFTLVVKVAKESEYDNKAKLMKNVMKREVSFVSDDLHIKETVSVGGYVINGIKDILDSCNNDFNKTRISELEEQISRKEQEINSLEERSKKPLEVDEDEIKKIEELIKDLNVKIEEETKANLEKYRLVDDEVSDEFAIDDDLDFGDDDVKFRDAEDVTVEEVISETPEVVFRSDYFYSPTENALNSISQERGTVAQWKAMLLKNGAKEAEMDWMGWDDHFGDSNKKVSKTDIQNWINQNRIDVQEVRKGEVYQSLSLPDGYSVQKIDVTPSPFLFTNAMPTNMWFVIDEEGDLLDSGNTEIEAINRYHKRMSGIKIDTKHSNYQEPGGENYKEILLTMPSVGEYREENGEFKSTHFSEPNILTHIRFNERTDVDGKKVLFIEEIQSDWAQKGKKYGYISDYNVTEDKAVPDMPFKKTEQWVSLALRRMLLYAAENGFDKLAWTPGEIQSKRYDLRKQVEKIEYSKVQQKDGNESLYDVMVEDKNGNKIYSNSRISESELEDVIGKDVTQKIVSTASYSNNSLSGVDLVIGDEGMKIFYDKILPAVANKIVKKYGAKTNTLKIPTTGKESYNEFSDTVTLSPEAEEIHERYIMSEETGEEYSLSDYVSDMKNAGYEVVLKNGEPVTIRENSEGKYIDSHSIDITEPIKEQAKIGMPLYKDPIRSKVAKTDRFGFQIGDASHHNRYEVREFPNYPEVVSSVSKSWNSESVYVKYFNTKNARSITVRFSNHMNNAVLFGDQLTPAATNEEILYELGILGRKPIIEESPRIVQQQIAKKDLDKYEEAELSLQEMYKLGIGADISKYKGKLAKNSNLLIESDTIKSKFNIVGFEYFEISKTDSKNELTEYAKEVAASLGIEVEVIDDVNKLPNGNTRMRTAKGWYSPKRNKIYIIPGNHKDKADVQATILHEAVAHMGLRGLLGSSFNSIMEIVFESMSEGDKANYLAKYGDKITAAEEYCAAIAEENSNPTLLDRVIGMIKNAFRSIGAPLHMNDADIKYMLWRSAKRLKSGKNDVISIIKDSKISNDAKLRFRDSKLPFETNDIRLSKFDKVREKLQDRMIALRNLQDEIISRGGEVPLSCNPYIQENLSSSRAKREQDIFKEKYYKPLMDHIDKMLKSQFGSIEENYTELCHYIIAKHAPERNRKIVCNEVLNIIKGKLSNDLKELIANNSLSLIDEIYSLYGEVFYITDKDLLSIDSLLNDKELDRMSVPKTINRIDYDDIELTDDQIKEIEKLRYAIIENFNKIKSSERSNIRSGYSDAEAVIKADRYESYYDHEVYEVTLNETIIVNDREIEKLWSLINSNTKFTLDKWLQYGFISQESYDYMSSTYPYEYYVPLRGWEEKEEIDYEDIFKSGYFGNEILNTNKAAEGRISIAEDPFAHIASMAESAIVAGNKNEIRRQAYRMVVLNRQFDDLFNIKSSFVINIGTDEDPKWVETFDRPTSDMFENGKAKYKIDKHYEWHKTNKEIKLHEVPVYIDGQRLIVEFKGNIGERVATAINGTNVPRPNGFIESSAKVNRWIAANLTSRNPAFVIPNFMRDLAFGSVSYYVNGGDYKKLIANIPLAMKAVHNHLTGVNGNMEVQKLYEDFMANGGQTGYVHLVGVDEYKKEIAKMRLHSAGVYTLGDRLFRNKAMEFGSKTLDYMAMISENTMRFTVYYTEVNRLLEEENAKRAIAGEVLWTSPTVDMHKAAAYAAKESTTNFNRKGTASQTFGALYAFFNASVQGTRNGLALAKRHPKKFTKAISALVAFSLVSHLLSAFVAGDGDDGENEYFNLSEYVRYNNFIFVNPFKSGKKEFITIPAPHFFRAFTSIGALTVEIIYGKKKFSDATWSLSKNIASEVIPTNISGFDATSINSAKGLFNILSPTPIRPIVEAYLTEIDYKNEKIVNKPYVSMNEKHIPQWQMANKKTNKLLIGTTKFINNLAGGTDNTSSAFYIDNNGQLAKNPLGYLLDINPSRVEHIFEGYLGGRLKFWNDTYKTAANALNGEVIARDVPVFNRLYQSPREHNNAWALYFETRDEVERLKLLMESMDKTGNVNELKKLNNGYNIAKIELFESYYNTLKDINSLYHNTSGEAQKNIEQKREEIISKFEKDINAINKIAITK